jgi:hypothetical protein
LHRTHKSFLPTPIASEYRPVGQFWQASTADDCAIALPYVPAPQATQPERSVLL